VYDRATFEPLGTFSYEGEGWGLCFDGTTLYMSDGSSTISLRDPATFEPLGALPVTLYGRPLYDLNEMECAGDVIYANVWHTDAIVRIDKASGEVTAVIDASGLLAPEQRAAAGREGVLNGIAYNPADDTFFITGKLWPLMFRVRFVPG
jgi:glutaminyl-peptide cyclotransferase